MKARFNTPCNACGGQIKVGQEIAKNNQGNWVHKECTEGTEGTKGDVLE